jgi:hypothetical protein
LSNARPPATGKPKQSLAIYHASFRTRLASPITSRWKQSCGDRWFGVAVTNELFYKNKPIAIRDCLDDILRTTSRFSSLCFFFFDFREDFVEVLVVHHFSFDGWVRENTTRRGVEWEAPRFFDGEGVASQRLNSSDVPD